MLLCPRFLNVVNSVGSTGVAFCQGSILEMVWVLLLLLLLRCLGLGAGHLRGCWICCVLGETCLSMEACGFWWATCAAAGGKSLSPRAITPEMNTVGLGGLVLSHSWSSLSLSSFPSPVCGCFCTIRIPPAFTAGGCPALVSSFPSGGEDMAPLVFGGATAAAGWASVRARGLGGRREARAARSE